MEDGTVVLKAAPHQPINSTAGGCGRNRIRRAADSRSDAGLLPLPQFRVSAWSKVPRWHRYCRGGRFLTYVSPSLRGGMSDASPLLSSLAAMILADRPAGAGGASVPAAAGARCRARWPRCAAS